MNPSHPNPHDTMVLTKYSIFVSSIRNIFTSSVVALAILGGGTSSVLFDNVTLKPYVKLMGIALLIITVLYGWNNINDIDHFVHIKKIINEKTNLFSTSTIKTDILLMKLYLIILIFVIIVGFVSFLY